MIVCIFSNKDAVCDCDGCVGKKLKGRNRWVTEEQSNGRNNSDVYRTDQK